MDSICWKALPNNVYNITDYIKMHPGGEVIMEEAGKDGTDAFCKRFQILLFIH